MSRETLGSAAQIRRPRTAVRSPPGSVHILQLSLHSTTVTTVLSSTPGDDGSIAKNGSKCAARRLDLLHILQMIPCTSTVTTEASITPGHNRSVATNGSKRSVGGLDLMHVLQLIPNVENGTTTGCITPCVNSGRTHVRVSSLGVLKACSVGDLAI